MSATSMAYQAPEPPNRVEFWRDCESARRLMTPKGARQFLAQRCRAQAMDEARYLFNDLAKEDEIAVVLWQACIAYGYHMVPLRHIEAKLVSTRAEQTPNPAHVLRTD